MVDTKPKRKNKPGAGRPSHVPTPENRKKVKALAANCLDQDTIATLLEMSKTTLHKYYKEELEYGIAHQKMIWGQKLMDGIKAGNTALICFFGKTRMGLKETSVSEIKGEIKTSGWTVNLVTNPLPESDDSD